MPRVEGASCASMVEANLEINKKMQNMFGVSGGQDLNVSRQTSTLSGRFGGAIGSFASPSNASVKD